MLLGGVPFILPCSLMTHGAKRAFCHSLVWQIMGWSEKVKLEEDYRDQAEVPLLETARCIAFVLNMAGKRIENEEAEKLTVLASTTSSSHALR